MSRMCKLPISSPTARICCAAESPRLRNQLARIMPKTIRADQYYPPPEPETEFSSQEEILQPRCEVPEGTTWEEEIFSVLQASIDYLTPDEEDWELELAELESVLSDTDYLTAEEDYYTAEDE